MKTDWEVKKLGEVCLIKPQKGEARAKLNGTDLVSFVPMEDLGIGEKYFQTSKTRTLEEVAGSYTYFADNDVLLAKITPCFENGKLGIASKLKNGIGFGSSEYIVFRADKTLNNEFLYYFLSRRQFREEGAKKMSGAVGHKRVSKEFIDDYQIPLPPLAEQQRIVAILDEAFAAIDKAKENAQKNLQNARELFDSYLQSVFANPGEDWEEKRIGNIGTTQYGLSESMNTEANGFKIFRMGEVQNGRLIDTGNMKYAAISKAEFEKYKLNDGDILFNRTNSYELVGKTGIFKLEGDYCFASYLIRLKYDTHKIYPWFLNYLMNSTSFQQEIKKKAAKSVNQANINATILSNEKIIIPPLDEQQRIVAKLDALSSETKKLEAIYQQKLTDLDELKKAILQKAFQGELTATSANAVTA